MVAINYPSEDKGSIESNMESLVSVAIPLYKNAEGEFNEEATYHLNGKIYKLKDLPEELVKTLGFIFEDYLRIFGIIYGERNDNQR